MGATAAIAMGAGTLMSAAGQAAAARANRNIAEYNARQLDAQAADALARGEEAAGIVLEESRQLRGAQRAAIAASGVTLDSATAQAIERDALATAARNLRTVRSNAVREAWGLKAQSQATRYAGRVAYRGAMLNSAGEILTGGAATAGAVRDYRYRGRGTGV